MILERVFRTFGEGLIHPVTGGGFLRAEETHALHFKLGANERVEVHALGDDVAAEGGGRHTHDAELFAEALILLVLEEGDLAFVVFLPVEETVSHQALTGDAFSFLHLDHQRCASRLTVVAEEIVLGGDVKMQDLHARLGCSHKRVTIHTSMTSSEQLIRIGIIGAGGIVKSRHMPGLRAVPNVQVTQVTNLSLASAEAFCREFAPEAQAVERWEEVASSPEVDVVWIGTHPYMHAEMTCYALQHGKHVFTQARMAASLPEANQMWEASIRYPELVTALCPAPHGMKGGELVKQLLAEGAIGTPHQVLLHSFNDGWLDATAPAHWRQQSELSGIQILTLGIYTEVLQRWLGHIVEIEARGNVVIPERNGVEVDIPDFVNVMAKFRSGIEATMLFSGVAAHAPTDKLWIFGSKGTLSYDFNTDDLQLGKRGGKLESVPIPTEMQRSWTVERDFIAAVRNSSVPRPKPDFSEGMNYMRVVHAVWQAMDAQAAVRVM